MKELPEKAAAFFKSEQGFARLMRGFIRNYKRLGRIGGTVKLAKLTQEEKEALSGIMGKDYSRQNSVTISMADFQFALEKTKFSGLNLNDLLQAYWGKPLLTRSEEEEIYQQKKARFFAGLKQTYPSELQQLIIDYIATKGPGTRGIHQAYDNQFPLLQESLAAVLSAVEVLPKTYERLPVFANRVTGDPHGFDLHTETGRLFVLALQIMRVHRNAGTRIISSPSAEEVTEILGECKLIRDDLLNFVTCTGLLGLNENEQLIPMWQEALQQKAVMNVPLRELIKIEYFLPAADCPVPDSSRKVFIVENSGVYSEILDRLQGEIAPPLICTHGQFKLAALLLIDKLVQKKVAIYYSGDFDPEGLQMAQRLMDRHPEFIKLWHYTVKDYEYSISHVTLSQTRLNKLASVTAPSLAEIKNKMLSLKMAGYQEQLVPHLAADLLHCTNSEG